MDELAGRTVTTGEKKAKKRTKQGHLKKVLKRGELPVGRRRGRIGSAGALKGTREIT